MEKTVSLSRRGRLRAGKGLDLMLLNRRGHRGVACLIHSMEDVKRSGLTRAVWNSVHIRGRQARREPVRVRDTVTPVRTDMTG